MFIILNLNNVESYKMIRPVVQSISEVRAMIIDRIKTGLNPVYDNQSAENQWISDSKTILGNRLRKQ